MDYKINSAEELGALLWAVRKAQGLRQDDTAGSIGVSEKCCLRAIIHNVIKPMVSRVA